MIALMLVVLCACTGAAEADGAPPFPDGKASEVALSADAEPSIVAVDQAAVEDHEARSPLELPDQDRDSSSGGEVQARSISESGGVVIDPELVTLLVGEDLTPAQVSAGIVLMDALMTEVASRRPPGMEIPWYSRYSDEIAVVVLALLGFLLRRFDLKSLRGQFGALSGDGASAPLPPDEARTILAQRLAEVEAQAQREIAARDRRIALLEEAERRATRRQDDAEEARKPVDQVSGTAYIERLEAKARVMALG